MENQYSNYRFSNEYRIIGDNNSEEEGGKEIGRGGYSKVFRVEENLSGMKFALKFTKTVKYEEPKSILPVESVTNISDYKTLFLDPLFFEGCVENISSLIKEAKKVDTLSRVNIGGDPVITIQSLWMEEFKVKGESIPDSYQTGLFTLLELGECDLYNFLNERTERITDLEACKILINISMCLDILEKEGKRHGDVKMDNLIVLDKQKAFTNRRGIVLSDYTLATPSNDDSQNQTDFQQFLNLFEKLRDEFCEMLGVILPNFTEDVKKFEDVRQYIIDATREKYEEHELHIIDPYLQPLVSSLLRRIGVLEKKVEEQGEQIYHLNKKVTEQDERLTKQSEQISHLNKNMTKQGEQINALFASMMKGQQGSSRDEDEITAEEDGLPIGDDGDEDEIIIDPKITGLKRKREHGGGGGVENQNQNNNNNILLQVFGGQEEQDYTPNEPPIHKRKLD